MYGVRERKPLYTNVAKELTCGNVLRFLSIEKTLTTEEKGSISSSVIAFGKYNGPCQTVCPSRDIAIKASFQYDPVDIYTAKAHKHNREDIVHHINKLKSLSYESVVYSNLFHKLAEKPSFNHYYNMVPYVTSLSCVLNNIGDLDTLLSQLDVTNRNALKFRDALLKLYQEQYITTTAYPNIFHILITEKAQEVLPMANLFESQLKHPTGKYGSILEDQLRSYILQALITLQLLIDNNIQHNDMHLKNVLVDVNPNEKTVFYEVTPTFGFKVPMQYGRVLLFDWDNAHCAECGMNSYIDQYICQDSGVCSKMNIKYDLYTFLISLYITLKINIDMYPEFQNFVSTVINLEHLPELASISSVNRMSAKYGYEGPSTVMNIYDALKLPYFDIWRVK